MQRICLQCTTSYEFLKFKMMTREYLIKVIDKYFWVLSRQEISEQIPTSNIALPDFLLSYLKQQHDILNDISKRSAFQHYFYDAVDVTSRLITCETKQTLPNPLKMEKMFNEALLLISIYYHYQAVMLPNTMAAFIRLILKEKILLA